MLSAVISAQDWQLLAHGVSNHESVPRTNALQGKSNDGSESIRLKGELIFMKIFMLVNLFVGLSKRELDEVKTNLTNVRSFFQSDIARRRSCNNTKTITALRIDGVPVNRLNYSVGSVTFLFSAASALDANRWKTSLAAG